MDMEGGPRILPRFELRGTQMRYKIGAEQLEQVPSLAHRPTGLPVGQDRPGRSDACGGRRDRRRRLRDRGGWA
jgi:hypothetical protein